MGKGRKDVPAGAAGEDVEERVLQAAFEIACMVSRKEEAAEKAAKVALDAALKGPDLFERRRTMRIWMEADAKHRDTFLGAHAGAVEMARRYEPGLPPAAS